MDQPTILVADFDFGDVDIERAIIEGSGFRLTAAQCKSEDDVIAHGRDADGWRPTNPLFRQSCAIITPRAAHYSETSIAAVWTMATEAVRVLSGLPARSPVNSHHRFEEEAAQR